MIQYVSAASMVQLFRPIQQAIEVRKHDVLLKSSFTMIDMFYNLRVSDIHTAELTDEFSKLCIPFYKSLSEEQVNVYKAYIFRNKC